jgi:hypothetical protein
MSDDMLDKSESMDTRWQKDKNVRTNFIGYVAPSLP